MLFNKKNRICKKRQDKHDNKKFQLTEIVLGSCFDVMNELGSGFLESVYKNALYIALKEKGLKVEVEKRFEVFFRSRKVGLYIVDLIVEESVIIELKCCESILGDHQAQVINYLRTCSKSSIG
ncbi:MAG: GxxExxY protein [Candidatus Protochlamydia sp.]|nr:GxxExxY protein [Candidatus Protochlamydia sp.]